jgi:hypothetical protein
MRATLTTLWERALRATCTPHSRAGHAPTELLR